jgi:hypothetical protein
MNVEENFTFHLTGRGRTPALRKLSKFNEKKNVFAAYYLTWGYDDSVTYGGSQERRIMVRGNLPRKMRGQWDDYAFYLFKWNKTHHVVVYHEEEFFRVRYSELLFDEYDKPRKELFKKVMDKEITAFDALMLVSL